MQGGRGTKIILDRRFVLHYLIGMTQHRLTKSQRDEIPGLYLSGISSQSLANSFCVSSVAIRGILKRRGVTLRDRSQSQKKCTLDDNAFDVLTPDACYWAGFIFADGCLFHREGSPSLTVRLAEKDEEHLHKLASFLKSSHKILKVCIQSNSTSFVGTGISYQLSVRSAKIVNRLEALGCDGLLSVPFYQLQESRDFWRGVIDGDGCLGVYEQPSYFNKHPKINAWSKPRSIARIELVGGEPLLHCFVRFIQTICPCAENTVKKHKSIFRVGIGGNTAIKIANALYEDSSVSLDRKCNAARNIRDEGLRILAGGTPATASGGDVSRQRSRKTSGRAVPSEARSLAL